MGKEAPFNPPYPPEQWYELKPKTTADERLIWAIFGSYPRADEIMRRTPEEVATLKEAARQGAIKRALLRNSIFNAQD